METIARNLESLPITDFEDDSTSEEVALKKMAADIQMIIRQAQKERRNYQYRKLVLNDGTRGRKWALQVSSLTSFMSLNIPCNNIIFTKTVLETLLI